MIFKPDEVVAAAAAAPVEPPGSAIWINNKDGDKNNLDDKINSSDVNLGLIENCRSKLYKKSTDLVEFALKLMGVKLTFGSTVEGAKNKLTKDSLWQCQAPNLLVGRLNWLAKFWSSPMGRMISIVFPIYILTKWLILLILQIIHDILLRKLRQPYNGTLVMSKVLPGVSCVLPHAYDWWYLNEELTSVRRWIDFFGTPFTGKPGFAMFVYSSGLLYPLMHLPIGWLAIYLYELRLDWLAFLNEPFAERRRLRLKLEEFGEFLVISTRSKPNASALTRSIRAKVLRLDALDDHLNHRWHKSLMSLTYRLFILISRFVTSLITFISLALLLVVSNQNLNFRLLQMQCQKWNREANLDQLKHFASPRELANVHNISKQDLNAYLNYDGSSWAQYLYLVALVEPKYSLTLKAVLTCLELSLTCFVCAVWFFTSYTSYLLSIVDKIVWLRQIDRQLETCIRLAKRGAEKPLLKVAAKTYLNFALFRSQFNSFRLLANLMVGQATLINLTHLWNIVLVKRTVSELAIRQGLLFITFASFFLTLNCFFVAYSYLFLLIERAMKSIAQLLATIEQQMSPCDQPEKFELRFWRDMWHRQLLDGHEMSNLYGLALFTIQVNFANFIQINVYPIVALTYLV